MPVIRYSKNTTPADDDLFRDVVYEEYYDEINTLPDEILVYIFGLLPLEDVLACENVCERWRKLARDSAVWKRITVTYSGKPGQEETNVINLEAINTHSQYITSLKLQYLSSYPTLISLLAKCDNLTSLSLVMCRIIIDFKETIKKWPKLKTINLKNSLLPQNSEELNFEFDYFKNLKHLTLSDFGLNTTNCNTLLRCKHLTHIFVEKIKDLNLEFVKELISSKKEILEAIHIYGGDAVDDECLKLISQCTKLTDLGIIRCENLTDAGLISLVNLKKIIHLQIWNNTVFTEANLLRTLSSPALVTLKTLSLSRIENVSPDVVDVIYISYKNLKFLALYQCPKIVGTDFERQLKSKVRNIEIVLY